MTILETITAYKKKEVESCKSLVPLQNLQKSEYFERNTYNLKEHLLDRRKTGIIAEFKRKSPSKGIINDTAEVTDVTTGYAQAGASALSVLTDFKFFGGSNDDLVKTRKANKIPLLRKEFIIDEYQVYEAKGIGADAILLIAAILSKKQAKMLAKLAHDLNLQVVMEFHHEKELGLLNEYIDIAGVNNRNLDTFEVSLQVSAGMATKIPPGIPKISESGISSSDDILFLRKHGFDAFLIGENFMKAKDPVHAFCSFTGTLRR